MEVHFNVLSERSQVSVKTSLDERDFQLELGLVTARGTFCKQIPRLKRTVLVCKKASESNFISGHQTCDFNNSNGEYTTVLLILQHLPYCAATKRAVCPFPSSSSGSAPYSINKSKHSTALYLAAK